MKSAKKAIYLLKKNPSYFPFLLITLIRKYITLGFFDWLGFSLFPELVTILITKRCNFNCPGCSSASPTYTKKFYKDKLAELTTEEIKRVINQVSLFKPFIYFNGGEPTLRDDLSELIKYAKEKKLVCALTTNGSMLNKRFLGKLLDTKLDFLSVSIDGQKEFHDKIRGFPGAFDRAVGGIKELIKLKKDRKITYPHIRIASIIYPNKIENAKFIVSLANELGVDEIGFGPLMYYPKRIIKEQELFVKKHGTGGPDPIGLEIGDNQKLDFSAKDYLDFLDYLKKEAQMPVYFAYQGDQYEAYFDPRKYPNKKSVCFTPWSGVLIQPNGDLEVCQGFKFGNVKNGSILGQWNNKKIREFRKLRARMPFPACFRCNEGQRLMFD
jgi:MoaA/NifB/PqqE/SkfB family radical SAM enzyme